MSGFTDFGAAVLKLLNRIITYVKNIVIRVLSYILPFAVKKKLRTFLDTRAKKRITEQRSELKLILANLKQGIDYQIMIIFPPSLDWNVQLFQRPQQLALALARQGALVFYLQPKPDRTQPPFQLIGERLYLCNVYVEVFQDFLNPLIYLLTWNSDYASCFNNPRLIYDFVDDIDVFYGDHHQIVKGHQFLLKRADLC
jgi:hypothetical protein